MRSFTNLGYAAVSLLGFAAGLAVGGHLVPAAWIAGSVVGVAVLLGVAIAVLA